MLSSIHETLLGFLVVEILLENSNNHRMRTGCQGNQPVIGLKLALQAQPLASREGKEAEGQADLQWLMT